MRFPRRSGLICHPTSFPGRFGIGELGQEAFQFIDFLEKAGQRIWQVLPLGPTGYGDSPYSSFSAFAGNPYLINLDQLVEAGHLLKAELDEIPHFPEDKVDFGNVIPFKQALLNRAATRFHDASGEEKTKFDAFCSANQSWLDDYSLFMAVKDSFDGKLWTEWDEDISRHESNAVEGYRKQLHEAIFHRNYQQFMFYQQWNAVKEYANSKGIVIMGDIPIYVSLDSSDVWSNPKLYKLDEHHRPTVVSGVPPDYFSKTGQLWGNPIYDWDAHDRSGYSWWLERFQHTLTTVDIIRLDHFRGFESYWEVPAGDETAENGVWKKGPGTKLFKKMEEAMGALPIIAEDLGIITKEVEQLRDELGLPGMGVMQFAFGSDAANTHLPHNYKPNLCAYTGTHDNDTTVGWWMGGEGSTLSNEAMEKERDYARRYLSTDGWEIEWVLMRAVMASVADTAVFPLQDVFGLGSDARMNQPGRPIGNWQWRYRSESLQDGFADRLKEMVELYGRDNSEKE